MVCNELHYLKSYRKRAGIPLKDMADILGMDAGNLSKMESCKKDLRISVAIAYYLILNIPFKMLFKHHYPNINAICLKNTLTLKETILEDEGNHIDSPHFVLRTRLTEAIIERLVDHRARYEKK